MVSLLYRLARSFCVVVGSNVNYCTGVLNGGSEARHETFVLGP
jgi:hypothetical protein